MSNILEKIIHSGRKILSSNSKYLDETGYIGHYDIGLIDYKKSHGPYLVTTDGKTYFDLTAYWNTNIIDAKKHPKLSDTTLFEYLGRLTIEAPTASEMVTAEQAAFIAMMKSFWPEAARIYTHPSGALAVNDACWTAATEVAEREGLKPTQMKGVVFEGAFHGRHDRSADATASTAKVAFRQIPQRFIRCSAPNIIVDQLGNNLNVETQNGVAKSLKEVEKAFKNRETAYVIIEYPFQAEGGARLVDSQALKKLHDLCQKYGKILIVDCIQMGGRVFAKNRRGKITPFPVEALEYADIITFGKVFRVSGFMARDPLTLGRGFAVDPMTKYPERYGSTWVGGLFQMVAGAAIMETVMEERLWKNGLHQTQAAYKSLKKMAKDYPGILLKPRGRVVDTTYLAWDFLSKQQRDKFMKLMREKYHVLILPAGDKSIRWAPFLDINDKEMSKILSAMNHCLNAL